MLHNAAHAHARAHFSFANKIIILLYRYYNDYKITRERRVDKDIVIKKRTYKRT